MNLIRIPNMNSWYALQNHEEGEIAWIEDIQEYRMWHNGQWVVLDPKTKGVDLSLYEVNKQLIAQMPTLSGTDLEEAKSTLSHYVNGLEHSDDYYMLLCYDLRYFTMFARDQKYE